MNRDPFYRQIIERLNSTLDPELFEQCAADLLRRIWPGLTPIRGGTDAGMDGAIPDGRGEPYPLITTTNENVIGNFSSNLSTYLREGGKRRRVVLATSRSLTPRRQNNLLARAQDLGFELISIQEQASFAYLLYRDPPWCLELLNLPSTPHPLSKIPVTGRPFFDVPLIGRQPSLDWLGQTTGDRVLIGQPASGKTFLLQKIAQEDRGLFLVTKDRGEIAAGIRSQQPTVILVDDAGPDRNLLLALLQMRAEIGANFFIIAVGWPGDESTLVETLNLPNDRIHRLEPLTRDQIKEVIYGVGVRGPNELVREIVDQAEGRPGLAVTLALLWLQGGRREVALGDTPSDSVVNFAERFVRREAAQILAIIAMSGDAGLPLSAIAQLSGLPEIEAHGVLNQLTASGVIMDVGEGMLTVRPPVLRYALVRNVFFRGVRLPIAPILERVPNRPEAALVLIGARERGAAVSNQLLRPLVIESRSTEVWKAYAGLGREEAEWGLRQYPSMLAMFAAQGLLHAPEAFLPALLTAAISDRRPLNQFPDHPLRQIEHWIESAHPDTGQAFLRRRLMLDATEIWLPENGDWRVGSHALQFALSPSFHYLSADPGQGHYVVSTSGILLPYELSQIQSLWPRVSRLINGINVTDWSIMHRIIQDWVYGGRIRRDLPGEVRDVMNAFAVQMLREVVSLARQHPATLHWASRLAQRLDADIAIELDPDFEILYPPRDHEQDFNEAEEREHAAVDSLAERWSREAPWQIARKIAQIEADASSAALSWPRWTYVLCNAIAARVTSRVSWARACMNANLSSDLVLPFLRLGAETDEEDWENLALECLELPEMRTAAVALALTLPHPPTDLFEQALQLVDESAGYVKWACSLGKIPEHHLRLLLCHPNPAIACAAAEGEWEADPQRTVRESLREDWEEAVVHSSSDYWLREVFRAIPDLAFRWLQNHLADEEFDIYDPAYEETIQSAVIVLTVDRRGHLLDQIPDHYGFDVLIIGLVTGYPGLYQQLLHNERLQRYHLAPLAGVPEGEWTEKAILAYDAGYSLESITNSAVFGHHGGAVWSGPWSTHWSEWVERFERLRAHPDERIQRIGETGRTWAIRERDDAQRRERREAVYGE